MTKRHSLILSILCAVVSLTTAAQSSPKNGGILASNEQVENLGTLKLQLQRYYACTCTCGCYSKDLDHQAQLAIDFLARRVARRSHEEKLAVVLDIDETALSNYKEMADADYGYNSKAFDAWEDAAQDTAIPGTLRLYREAQRQGVSVFFITGRSEAHRAATEQNLKSQGYADWQRLILRSPHNPRNPQSPSNPERAKPLSTPDIASCLMWAISSAT